MVEVVARPGVSALAEFAVAGQRLGQPNGPAGVTVREVAGLAIASLAARTEATNELAVVAQSLLGLALPTAPKLVVAGTVRAMWTGPGQWLILSSDGERGRIQDVRRGFAGLASVTDQSDSRAVLEVSGPHARDALAKGFMVDLHPSAFRSGDTAVTLAAHISAQISKLDDAPTFFVMVPRSFSQSFWSWLVHSASEFGLLVGEKADKKHKA